MSDFQTIEALDRSAGKVLRFLVILTGVIAVSILFAVPAAADPVGVNPRDPKECGRECDSTGNNQVFLDCRGSDMWTRDRNGWIALTIEDDPRCSSGPVTVWDGDGETDVWEPECVDDWDKCWERKSYPDPYECTTGFHVWRFYGSGTSSSGYSMSKSYAKSRAVCRQGQESFFFQTPHPHDAGVYGGSAFATQGRWTTTAFPTSGAGICRIGDDPAKLSRFFKPDSEFDDPNDKAVARAMRQQFGTLYGKVQTALGPSVPTVYGFPYMNISGTTKYAGDNFTSVAYSDGRPCSSGLDFAVTEESGKTPQNYGICFVEERYDAYEEFTHSRTDDVYYAKNREWPKRTDSVYADIVGTKLMQPLGGTESGSIVNAMRGKLPTSISGAKGNPRNLASCFYGTGQVINTDIEIADEPDIRNPLVTGQNLLAYVGGDATKKTYVTPRPQLRCNSNLGPCPATVRLVDVHSLGYSFTPRSWQRCTSSNRRTCDYNVKVTDLSNETVRVEFWAYTATERSAPAVLQLSGTAVIQYTVPAASSGLSICIDRTWAAFTLDFDDDCFTAGGATGDVTVQVTRPIQFSPITIDVAGSRIIDSG